jgi:hypothetical protein
MFVIFIMLLGSTLLACGGDDGGTSADAAVDMPVDMPAPLTGLGQKCGQGLPACPSNASQCLSLPGATSGFCSAVCLTGATGMTNAMSQFTSLSPLPNDATCTGAYSGTVGTAGCGLLLTLTPMEQPMANKSYTNISMACGISCGPNDACPFGTACNSTFKICLPT